MTGRRVFRTALLVASVLLGLRSLPLSAQAGVIDVRASFDRSVARENESLMLEISVEARNAQVPQVQMQMPEGFRRFFEVLSTGTSIETRITNGQATARRRYQYRLRAIASGEVALDPVRVVVGNDVYVSDPLRIRIEPEMNVEQAAQVGNPRPYFAEVRVDADEPLYPGEEVRLTVVVYAVAPIRDWDLSNAQDVVSPQRFRAEVLERPQGLHLEEVDRGGIRYQSASILRMIFYPLVSGELEIPRFDVRLQLAQPPMHDPGSQSVNSLFQQFFGGQRGRVVETSVSGQKLDVLPLPEEGRPPAFDGAVGEMAFSSRVERAQAKTGEAFSYMVIAQFRGDPNAVHAPELDLPRGWDGFDSRTELDKRVTPDGGILYSKTFTYLIVPRVPGRQEFSPTRFAWFDPRAGRYRLWVAPEIGVNVSGAPQAFSNLGTTGGREQQRGDEAGPDLQLRYIKPDAGSLRMDEEPEDGTAGLYAALLAPVGLFGASWFVARRRERARGDLAWRRRRRARHHFSAALRELEQSGDARERAAIAARALLGLVGDLWNTEAGGLRYERLESFLIREGVGEADARRVIEILRAVDEVRFSGGVGQPSADTLTGEVRRLGRALEEARRR